MLQRQLPQDGADTLKHGFIGLFGGPIGIQLAFEHVFRFQENINHVRTQRHFATADCVQKVFKQVGGTRQLRKTAECRRAALDGVGRAEDGIELLDVGRTHIEL
ncbi:hypothetical protein D3C78_1360940 [compost metagenome]